MGPYDEECNHHRLFDFFVLFNFFSLSLKSSKSSKSPKNWDWVYPTKPFFLVSGGLPLRSSLALRCGARPPGPPAWWRW